MHKLPPYIWVPPEWDGTPPLKLEGNSPTPAFPDPATNANYQEVITLAGQAGNAGFETVADEIGEIAVVDKTDNRIPHPKSDYRHMDPDQWPNGTDLVNDASVPRNQRASYRRMQLSFNWLLRNVVVILRDLNEAIIGVTNSKRPIDEYNEIRTKFIGYFENLDNHEPNQANGEVSGPDGLGFGANIKWIYLKPYIAEIITNPAAVKAQQKKADVVDGVKFWVQWNPHSSSSGIPIDH